MQATGGNGGTGAAAHAAATYRSLRSRHGLTVMGDINVTPLVDVVLVLLLVFMVTAPMMSRGIDVTLPVADQPDIEPEDRLTVSVNARGTVFIGEQPVALPLLEDQIRGRMQSATQKVVYIRADERLQYGKVIAVIDILKRAGVEQFGFVYDLPEEKKAAR